MSSIRLLIETLEVIHFSKRYSILALSESLEGVNVFLQFLHLNLYLPEEFLAHLIVLFEEHLGQINLYFLLH